MRIILSGGVFFRSDTVRRKFFQPEQFVFSKQFHGPKQLRPFRQFTGEFWLIGQFFFAAGRQFGRL